MGQSGRIASATATTVVVLDRSVTLAAATTYYVHVRMNALGQTGSGTSVADYMETVTVSSPAGTYAAGDSITVSSFVTVPAKGRPVRRVLLQRTVPRSGHIDHVGRDLSQRSSGFSTIATCTTLTP